MPTINANTSTQIALPAGQDISGTGAGVALVGNGASGAIPLVNGSPWQIGPFLTAQTVYITATSAITYALEDPLADPVRFTAPQVSAVQALVLGGGSLASPMLVHKSNQPVTRSSANVAGDATFANMLTFTVPGGSMGPNGSLVYELELANNNVAAAAEFMVQFGGANVLFAAVPLAAGAANFYNVRHEVHNTSATAQRYRASLFKQVSSTGGWLTTAIDTSSDVAVAIQGRWAAAVSGGVLTLHGARAWVEYGI